MAAEGKFATHGMYFAWRTLPYVCYLPRKRTGGCLSRLGAGTFQVCVFESGKYGNFPLPIPNGKLELLTELHHQMVDARSKKKVYVAS